MHPVERLAQFDAVMLEIAIGQVPAKSERLPDDGLAHVAINKEPRAILGEPLKRLGELFVAEGFAGLHQLAARCENLRDAGACREDRRDDGEEIGLEVAQGEASARRPHCRLDQALHRQFAQRLVHGEETGHHAGGGTRSEADMELLLSGAEIGVDGKELDLILLPPFARGLGEEVEEDGRVAFSLARHEEAAAARRGEHGLGDECHKDAGKRGVEGVAAVFQDFRRGGDRQFMARRDDCSSLAHGLCLRRSGRRGKSFTICHARESGHPVTLALAIISRGDYWIARSSRSMTVRC
jgi:hypothetical protein